MKVKQRKLLIVDDHPAMAYGTKMIVEDINNIQVVGIAHTVKICMKMAREFDPEIIFLDYMLPDSTGLDAAKQLKEWKSGIHIIIFTGIDYTPVYDDLIDIGISGIMPKDCSDEQIKNILRCVVEEQAVIPLALFRQLRLVMEGRVAPLTTEEVDIMLMVVKGSTNEQIANQIYMSKRSVDNYLRKIYEKLGVKMRPQAVEKFLEYKKMHGIN